MRDSDEEKGKAPEHIEALIAQAGGSTMYRRGRGKIGCRRHVMLAICYGTP